ncbi:CDP-diacylglycerol--serine O-phosphatidyltransferase [Paenibacillus sp. PK4536]|uniref:CDP-diacylglycerol--serine O-phosphatidyltransferase n=1 Tax=Paenibacillus TaxID=44249 RepID=UPI002358ECFE|nr:MULTISPECIES: CDP-diacylglycerol--serine O-phosphatidyltransferase [Paenibacillus]WIM40280.1 CDP-diacylglycerol--serine O-phosphatidyltransferase [Paenibacillus sp. PK4536]CAJ1317372.1 CDP-diacylglycerol--serine O-phosphatidyltransferase [Paenibacillus nuruki]
MKKMLPNLFTLGNLLSGFAAILLISQEQFEISVLLIVVGLVCDFLDGYCARILHATSEFGKELDSLADLITFGVAPAIFAYVVSLHEIHVVGAVCCLFYVCCSALRLARFNVRQSHMTVFVGMPTPVAAVLSILLTIYVYPLVAMVGIVLIGILMVSPFYFPSLKKVKSEAMEDC